MPKDLDPTTSPDAQEALSRAPGNRVIMVLPLSSGKFAILDRSFQLQEIVTEIPPAHILRVMSLEFAQRLKSKRVEAEVTTNPPKSTSPLIHIPLNIYI